MTNNSLNTHHVPINISKFKNVKSFKCLGVIVNVENERFEEVPERVQARNRAYFYHKKLVQDNNLSKKVKCVYTKLQCDP